MLDVGQAEAFVLDFDDHSFGVVDAGRSGAAIIAAVEARVQAGGEFRFAVVSHWDSDHIGGMPALLRAHRPEVFYLPDLDLALVERLLDATDQVDARCGVVALDLALRETDTTVLRASARALISALPNGVTGWFLGPSPSVRDELLAQLRRGPMDRNALSSLGNRASIVMWIQSEGRHIFLPGEVEGDQYREIRRQWTRREGRGDNSLPGAADVLKLSHHGSSGNNPIELFQFFAKPGTIGLASAGGRYGHPSPRSLLHLNQSGGTPRCTRLGQPCHLINSGLRPEPPDVDWVDGQDWTGLPTSGARCHGAVTVAVSAIDVRVSTGSTPSSCRFGGMTST